MPTLYNHSHFPIPEYAKHSPEKYRDMEVNGGLHSIRALVATTPEDVIQLDPRTKEAYEHTVEHLGRLGIATAANVVWDTSREVAEDFPDHELSVYGFGSTVHAVRPNQRRLDATLLAKNKNTFITYCRTEGYPVPETLTSDEPFEVEAAPLPAYVKAARSSSGVSIYRVGSTEELAASLELVGDDYQVQAEVADTLAFLNVQYYAHNDQTSHLATTEQILNGFSHAGNRYPSEHNPRHLTDPLANALGRRGVEGVFAFDVAVTPEEMLLIECNARWNGSTYPTVLAQRLGLETWTARTMKTAHSRPAEIELGELSYNPTERAGAILINTGFLASKGEVSVLLTGTEVEQQGLQDQLQARLNLTAPAALPDLASQPLAA